MATKLAARMSDAPGDVGLSRAHIVASCEASLRRLGTDWIDLYQAHGFDALVPVEETARAFEDLVRAGKVRHLGCSNFSGWHLMKALATSERLGVSRYEALQAYYSLVGRDLEHELLPACRDQEVGVLVWSPLAFGFLGGKYRRGEAAPADARLSQWGAPGTIDDGELERCSTRSGAWPRRAACRRRRWRWPGCCGRAGVTSVIVGARDARAARRQPARGRVVALATTSARGSIAPSARPLPYPYWHQLQFNRERMPPA